MTNSASIETLDTEAGDPGTTTFAVGLDIGGTKVLGVLLDADGTVLRSVRLPTVRGGDGVVRSATDVVQQLASDAGIGVTAIGSVGVGVPGLVDPLTGSVNHAVNLGIPGESFPLAARITDELCGPTVSVDNDLNVAALGASYALGPGSDDLAYLALGTGMAAGIVINGELRRGASGAAGEVGHIPIRPDGPVCACGQRGCVELYASGSGLARRWPSSGDVPAPLEIFAAAAAGDELAREIRADFGAALADVVRIITLSYDVERVVIGGGVTGLGPQLLELLREHLEVQARSSAFLASLKIGDRVSLAPNDVPIAAVGAALAGLRKD
ncbi:ROK family protein [Luteimicrobium subarcticum]|uniref:Putative NBD/HSP70 family sugar kinase n=1 Tax=Luteimicrobium subarcticum TaxID=620910 RepID=A0A2M8WUE8_9MICO|nr:ROK family protein [Luteimicrobium subarcticum]PJI94534.1 putative NBD/HSP70 family sugar kinase [Luteimicrobium subarcticum]